MFPIRPYEKSEGNRKQEAGCPREFPMPRLIALAPSSLKTALFAASLMWALCACVMSHAETPLAIDLELKEAESAFFDGQFDRALRRVNKAISELRDSGNQRQMASLGTDHGAKNIFARALKADILSSLGLHKQASALIRQSLNDVGRKRSFYIRNGVNPIELWLLEAYCELFAADIAYNTAKLSTYRINYSRLPSRLRRQLKNLLDDDNPTLMMNKATSWYEKAIDTLEHPFATGITQSSRVEAIDSQKESQSAQGPQGGGNGVELSWGEILAESRPDITRRLSSRCLVGLGRARMHALLSKIKIDAQEQSIADRLNSPASDFLKESMTLLDMQQVLSGQLNLELVADPRVLRDKNIAFDQYRIQFAVNDGSLLSVLEAGLAQHGLMAQYANGRMFVGDQESVNTASAKTNSRDGDVDIVELLDEAEGYYHRARELLQERRQYKFFIDPQREFAMSLKEVSSKALEQSKQGVISRDSLAKLASAYARTVIEWVTMEQDLAELSGLVAVPGETVEDERKRVIATKEKLTRLGDLVTENFSADHPAVFSASLSEARYRSLLATKTMEELLQIKNGQRPRRNDVSEEQLEVQVAIYREEALESVKATIDGMKRVLPAEHPLQIEAICVLLECVSESPQEDVVEFLELAGEIVGDVAAAQGVANRDE